MIIGNTEEQALRDRFRKEKGIPWENAQGEPDIDYVLWLESRIQDQEQEAEMQDLNHSDLFKAIEKIDSGHYGSAKNFISRFINMFPDLAVPPQCICSCPLHKRKIITTVHPLPDVCEYCGKAIPQIKQTK